MHSNKSLPQGFISYVGNVGLKDADPDCLLVGSSAPIKSAAVFTQSIFAGPSVKINRASMSKGLPFQGLVVISKNANVATGFEGKNNALEVQSLAANVFGVSADSVLIASTGVIGRPYPMERIRRSFGNFSEHFMRSNLSQSAKAIMTTDTKEKFFELKCGASRIVGIAKGVGMIEPNMATLLTFFFTDASIEQQKLDAIFRRVVEKTFNALSIDTDTSTSDTAAIFSNGLAGYVDEGEFEDSLHQCALVLVKKIIGDGEGATKTMIVNVAGARDDSQAKRVGKSVVNSPLVKTAVHGSDPNWGRVAMAIGKLDLEKDINPDLVKIAFGKQLVYPDFDGDLNRLQNYLNQGEIIINIDLGISVGNFTVYGCDLSEGYIRINADYTS